MNNPLNRKMFREAGMSKQPMGILASSPELMTTAQQAIASGQPIKAQNAVSVNTQATKGFGLNQSPSVPSGVGNFIKNAFTTDSPSALGQVINYGLKGLSAKKDSDADSATAKANKKSANKTVGPYSQAGITSATGPEIGITSAGDVDEKDVRIPLLTQDDLIFDGDKFNFYEDQKNAPSILSDLKAKSKDFKEAYTNAPSNLLNSVKKYVSKSSIAPSIDLENKSIWDNLKIIGNNAANAVESGLQSVRKNLQENAKKESIERALSAEDTGGLKNEKGELTDDYKELLQREADSRNEQFGFRKSILGFEYGDRKKVILQPGETGGPPEVKEKKDGTKIIKPQKATINNNKNTKKDETIEKKKSFTETQNAILNLDRKSEVGYTEDGGRTKEGELAATNRDLLYAVTSDQLNQGNVNNIVSEDNKTFKSNLGDVLGIKTGNMSLTERHTMYKKMLEGITGSSPKNMKSDANFNLIMTGLLIASGESPNAMTNIARGAAQGLKNYGDSLGEDRKEKREIQLAAFKLAVTADEAQKERNSKAEINRLNQINKKVIASIKKAKTYTEYSLDMSKQLSSDPLKTLGDKAHLTYQDLVDKGKTNEATFMLNDRIKSIVDTTWVSSGGELPTASDNSLHIEPNKIAKENGQTTYKLNGKDYQVQ